MVESKAKENDIFWMSGDYSVENLEVRRAIIKEKLSTLTETRVEIQCDETKVDIEELLGKQMTLHLNTLGGDERVWAGHCVSVENLGLFDGYMQIVAEVRPWLWFLTQSHDCRIFQEQTTQQILTEVFDELGFSGRYEFSLGETQEKRAYTVQYQESDFEFVCRLMEQAGMFYTFFHAKGGDKLRIVDQSASLPKAATPSNGGFIYRARSDSKTGEYIQEFSRVRKVRTGKVSLNDYNFFAPTAVVQPTTKSQLSNKHSHTKYENYTGPQRFFADDQKKGPQERTNLSQHFQQAEDTAAMQYRGAGNVPQLGTGLSFKMEEHEDKDYNEEFVLTEMVHYLQTDTDVQQNESRRDLTMDAEEFPEGMKGDVYNCTFGAVRKTAPFRAPTVTPWPKIPGMLTARVVGPSGEEIHTDPEGRIKVQFHWDLDGKKDDKSSCWVRVVTPWSGQNWGMIHLPRIHQEVVIQFEGGDPDRPYCTGMLYNADNKPPYELPANKTQSGIKTNSSKGGGGFNELMFEDKKDAELVRFQAQKDYTGLVKNHSTVTIGHEALQNKASGAGDHHQTIKNNVVETINDGDRTFTIETGSEIVEIQTDKTVTIHNDKSETIDNNNTREVGVDDAHTIGSNQTTDVGSDQTNTIGSNQTTDVGSDQTNTIGSNQTTDVGSDQTNTIGSNIDTSAGQNITVEAGVKIELKVGANSIKIEQSGITIKGTMVKIEGTAMAEMKSKLTTVKADAMLTLKGGVTMIN